ncbi:hypothetical protein BKA69DRAFT_1059046 [Paraphysoderma sedebokerense]|nr:hypothetical protein BKA69DRAFT_1059046 [Paraphysoderma sedebokerense]
MSALTSSSPLAFVQHYHPSYQVHTYRDEPIIESSRHRSRKTQLELFHVLATLEVLVAKESGLTAMLAETPPSTHDSVTTRASLTKTQGEITRVLNSTLTNWEIWKNDFGGVGIESFLRSSLLLTIYPKACSKFGASGSTGESEKVDMKSYLQSMTVMNQIVTLSLQLREDVNLTNHKYMAHQIALLYQSLSGAKDELKKQFRPRIESQFDNIKATCSATPDPKLTSEQVEW